VQGIGYVFRGPFGEQHAQHFELARGQDLGRDCPVGKAA
jgi:hypothetical protein